MIDTLRMNDTRFPFGAAACDRPQYAHNVALIASRFHFPRRRVLFGKARLFGDRIELEGWQLGRRYRRCIPLAEIAHLESYAHEKNAHLTLFLDSDEVVILYMKDAFLWRTLFENWMEYDVLPSARLMQNVEAAAALAG